MSGARGISTPSLPLAPLLTDVIGNLAIGGVSQTVRAPFLSVVAPFLLSNASGFLNQAALFANLNYPANSIATVWNDAVPANNGMYVKNGGTGTGSWTQVSSSFFGITGGFSIGTVDTLPPGANPTVVLGGTAAAPTLSFGLPTTQNFSIGPVTTLSAGSPAAISVTGTVNNPILNFSIPRGVSGAGSFAWRGAYSSITAFNINDVVSYGGASYIAVAPSTGVTPVDGSTWNILATGPNIQPDVLTVSALNTISTTLSKTPSGGLMSLVINGQMVFSPAFSVSGTTVTWSASGAGYPLPAGAKVIALYTY